MFVNGFGFIISYDLFENVRDGLLYCIGKTFLESFVLLSTCFFYY